MTGFIIIYHPRLRVTKLKMIRMTTEMTVNFFYFFIFLLFLLIFFSYKFILLSEFFFPCFNLPLYFILFYYFYRRISHICFLSLSSLFVLISIFMFDTYLTCQFVCLYSCFCFVFFHLLIHDF